MSDFENHHNVAPLPAVLPEPPLAVTLQRTDAKDLRDFREAEHALDRNNWRVYRDNGREWNEHKTHYVAQANRAAVAVALARSLSEQIDRLPECPTTSDFN